MNTLSDMLGDLGRLLAGAQRLGDDGNGPMLADVISRRQATYQPRTDFGMWVKCLVTSTVSNARARQLPPLPCVDVFAIHCPACAALVGAECITNPLSRACFLRIKAAEAATQALRSGA